MPVLDVPRPGSLRRHSDFDKLWLGQAISSIGSQVTLLALPLTAVLYLHAARRFDWLHGVPHRSRPFL